MNYLTLILTFLLSIFIIIGTYINTLLNKKNIRTKNVSINMLYGLLLLTSIIKILPVSYSLLSKNYHDTTYVYLILTILIGFIIIEIFNLNKKQNKNTSILSLMVFCLIQGIIISNYNIQNIDYISMIFLSIYNIIIGIYIKEINNKKLSIIPITVSYLIGLLLGNITNWQMGYLFSVSLGIIIYFIISLSSSIIKNKNSIYETIGLVIGMTLVLLEVLI